MAAPRLRRGPGGRPRLAEIAAIVGPDVARLVEDCTDALDHPKPAWRSRKEAYLAALPAKPPASLRASLADKVHDAEAILADHDALGEALRSRFTGGAEGTRWHYARLAGIFAEAPPGALQRRLARAVAGFAG